MERDIAPGSGDGHLDVAFAETKLTTLVENWESSVEELGGAVPAVQLRALLVVDREERLSVGRPARALGASPSATRRLCDRMAAAGLVARDPAPASRLAVTAWPAGCESWPPEAASWPPAAGRRPPRSAPHRSIRSGDAQA
jgi:hypothetical protein